MEGEGTYNSFRCFSIYFLFTGILSQDSLSPGPVVFVKDGSNVTFACSSTNSWNVIYFYDTGVLDNNLARVIFQANDTHCRNLYTDKQFGADKYTPLPCNVSQPVSIIVRYINTPYHNKSIACKVDTSNQYSTTVKIRELLTRPTMNATGNQTITENMIASFTCIATSIPKSSIEWHVGGSILTRSVTTTSLNETTIISTITFQAKTTHHNKDLYCTASNSFTTLNSSFAKLNILFVPTVHMDPAYDPYIMYVGQTLVRLICSLDDANPSNDITYHWTKPRGYAEGQQVTIANVSRTDSGKYRCIATNEIGNSSVSTKQITVHYNPLIMNISNVSIKKGGTLQITSIVDANPPPLSVWWTRKNNSTFKYDGLTLRINGIQKEASGEYICHAMNVLTPSGMNSMNKTSEKSITIDVLYIPEIHTEPSFNPYILYHEQHNVVLACVVDTANPATGIDYIWINPSGTTSKNQNITITTVEKSHKGEYSCTANNTAGPSVTKTKEINVQYIPSITNISDTSIVEGTSLNLIPNVDANPVPLFVWWTRQNIPGFRNDGLPLTIRDIKRTASGTYTFHAMNTITPSGMVPWNNTSKKNINIDVLYVPEIHTEPNYNTYIIYNKQEHVVLTCVVDTANPADGITYKWITPSGTVNNQNVTIRTVEKSHRGDYTCTAKNIAGFSDARKIQINVQYGPSISNIAVQEDIVEGKYLKVTPTVDSNPLPGFVWWTRQDSTTFRYDGSNLIIQNIQRDATGNYSCHVMNTVEPTGLNAQNITAKFMFYINVQYPPSTEIAGAPIIDVLENETVTLHCKVTDANPMKSSILWYQYSAKTLESTANYTIRNIHRSAAGDYICEARNTVGNGNTSVNINVLYGPEIKNLMVINGSIARENSSVFLECEVSSNPASDVEWIFNDIRWPDKDFIAGRSYYNIADVTCYHTGIYRCKATNKILAQVYNVSKEVQLFVNCSPRLNINMELPPNKIGLPHGGILNLSVNIVAYPELTTSEWIFRPNYTTNVTYYSESVPESNVFRHVINLFKPNLTEIDFGDYSLAVQNDVGSKEYTFHVVPEGPPEPSNLINATCGIQTALVYWETSFSGGDIQTFSVIVVSESKTIHLKTSVVSNTKGEIKHTLLNMLPGDYTFNILGENKYDSAISLDSKSCQVRDNPKAGNKSVVAAAAGGGVGAAAILIVILLLTLIIVKKRRLLKGKQFEENRKKLTEEDTEEGLKDNPLYGASEDINDDTGPMYSIVNKKPEESKNEAPVYSQVQIKKDRGTAKPVKDGNSLKKTKVSSNKKIDIEMGDIYENSDKIVKSKEKDEIYTNTESDHAQKQNQNGLSDHRKKNKDGLIYADLELAPSGKRFVIRGIENRNNYAIIDLSKTAEPLPSDDEDDNQSVKETDKATNNE